MKRSTRVERRYNEFVSTLRLERSTWLTWACVVAVPILLLGSVRSEAQTRYLDEVFATLQTTDAVPYGTTDARCGGSLVQQQTHLLTVYEPQGDAVEQRPVVVIVPGGGFTAENRNAPDIVALAQKLARRGYVTAAIDYRVCPELGPFLGNEPLFPAIVHEAQQDALAAIRFFRAKATRWHVDPSRIVIAGFSAGAVTALNAAFDPGNLPLTNDCCQNQPPQVCAVASLAGGTDPSLITAGEPPTLIVHHVSDPVVPVSLAQAVETRCSAVGVPVETHYLTAPLADAHFGIFAQIDDIVGWMAAHFYNHAVLGPGCGERRGVLVDSDFSNRIPTDWIRYFTAGRGQVSVIGGAQRSTVFQSAATNVYADAEINDWMNPSFQIAGRMPWRFVNVDFRLRTSNVNQCTTQGLSGTGVGTRGWGFWDGTANNFLWFLSTSDPSCGWSATTRANGGLPSGVPLTTDMTQWHDYRLVWRPTDAEFYIDGNFIASLPAPTVALGLVFWIDNGSISAPPYLALPEDQFVEIDSVRVYTSRARFTDAVGADQESFAPGTAAYISLDDPDENLDRLQPETVQVQVSSGTTADVETVTLTETAAASGRFTGALSLDTSPVVAQNGSLQTQAGDTLTMHYVDADDPTDTDADSAAVTSFTDDFAAAGSPFWGYIIGGRGPTVGTAGGQLVVTVPASSIQWGNGIPLNAGFLSACTLSGDFDVQAHYDLSASPGATGALNLIAWPASIAGPSSLGGVGRAFPQNLHLAFSPGNVATSPTSDTAATIRLHRTGSTAQGYFDDGGGWTAIGAPIPFSAEPVRLSLHLTANAGLTTVGRFDDFTVNSGTLSCPLNQLCGDGSVESQFGEACDDGNLNPADGCCACRAAPLGAIPDISGQWQTNVSCSGSATTVQTWTVTQSAGSSTAMVKVASCGTFAGSDGNIHPVTSCDLVSSHPAQVCGAIFAHDPPAAEIQFSPFVPPPGSLGGCTNVERVNSQVRFNGQITADASNRALAISGPHYLRATELFDSGQTDPCLQLAGSFCEFDMRRNTAGPGSAQVEPLAGVSVSFAQAYGPVQVVVVPETNASAALPPNFQIAPNVSGAPYLNITPTGSFAQGPGAITVCVSYPDATNDGVVDDTNPPIAEGDLKILHLEGGTFVDRTTTPRDVANNRICATVTQFSPFVLGAGAAPAMPSLCGAAPRNDCRQAATGKSNLTLRSVARGPLIWAWRGPGDAAEFGDPRTTTDYQLCLYDGIQGTPIPISAVTGRAASTCGSKPCWRKIRGGFSYHDLNAAPDGLLGLSLVKSRFGQKLVVKGKRPRLTIPALPLRVEPSVTAQLVNSDGYCWTADFSLPRRNDALVFKAPSD